MKNALLLLSLCVTFNFSSDLRAEDAIRIWPATAPGETNPLPPEADTTKADGRTVAGRRVIRLGNVSTPTLEIFRPASAKNTGAAVIVCPGGGHHILAYDLEGTEVAEWLRSIGVTGLVLKYRVPARDPNQRWGAAVQDAQRAVSLVRKRSAEWDIDPERIGLLGFSAGGQTAALASVRATREYDAVDEIDRVSHRPNFTALIYPAYLADDDRKQLRTEVTVDENSPPAFLVHAFNDGVPVENSLLFYLALKRAGVASELHAFSAGGHGFGMRPTDEPSSLWPEAMQRWLVRSGIVAATQTEGQ